MTNWRGRSSGGKARKIAAAAARLKHWHEATARRTFDALAEGGQVTMPLGKTFWSPLFGMVTDRYGVGWMVMVAQQG